MLSITRFVNKGIQAIRSIDTRIENGITEITKNISNKIIEKMEIRTTGTSQDFQRCFRICATVEATVETPLSLLYPPHLIRLFVKGLGLSEEFVKRLGRSEEGLGLSEEFERANHYERAKIISLLSYLLLVAGCVLNDTVQSAPDSTTLL
ncbi:MAG TPA: hypothetical protein VLG76_01690 [Rhabdochlamydiaceae bacterium]|nr:hypothetical protein [Rhabdochlamydiaceae bacterium]